METASLNYADYHTFLRDYVMKPFHAKRLDALQRMRLQDILRKKNPYLFKAKNIETAGDLAHSIIDAFLSSQEETMFGNLLEGFAIYVAHKQWGGVKSKRPSLDLEFLRDNCYYIVSIKSGTAWGNSDQIRAMKTHFKAARVALRNEGISAEIVAVNGCIYGKEHTPYKADKEDAEKNYYKYAGQEFWRFLSGDDTLYQEIIAPIHEQASQQDFLFRNAYTAKINELTREFSVNFLDASNQIDWVKLVNMYPGARMSH
jgi:site-specific DNA-methyltransferase (cytosine-N4-specific)